MLYSRPLAALRLLPATRVLLARQTKVEKPNKPAKAEVSVASAPEVAKEALPPPSATAEVVPAANETKTHILPQNILKDVLNTVSAGQQAFLFGNDKDAGDHDGGALRATGNFFETINTAYEGRMLQERLDEVESYVEKRRVYYHQRLDAETEEFRQEQTSLHEEIQRLESEKYKKELSNDIIQFTKTRETEYEVRLCTDVEKYYNALLAHRKRQKKDAKAAEEAESSPKLLNMNILEVMAEMELDDVIRDFGGSTGAGNDLSDQDIRSYVIQRTCFYEHCAQEEVHYFIEKRKGFYEELLEARAIRHAAKVRVDTERFRKERHLYYDERLTIDGTWMTKCFQEHYNRCFLQLYSRTAWIAHRRFQAAEDGIKIVTTNGEKIPSIPNPSNIGVSTLSAELPLSHILDIYESENIAEITRDVFLKAARRVASDQNIHSTDDHGAS